VTPVGKRRSGAERLTPAQEKFCQRYALEPNGAAAYAHAYPGSRNWKAQSRHVAASKLLATAKILPRLEALHAAVAAQAAKQFGVTVARIVGEYAKLGFSDIRDVITWGGSVATQDADTGEAVMVNSVVVRSSADIPAHAAAAIASVEQTKDGGLKVRYHDKKGALDSLARHLGMFTERHEHTGKNGAPIEVRLSDFERARRLAFLLASGDPGSGSGASPAQAQQQPAEPAPVNGAASTGVQPHEG